MGMQQKLQRAYDEGFEAGQKIANQNAAIMGEIRGATETWEIMEKMFIEIEGVGPKTREKILKAIKAYAAKEKARLKAELF